MPDSAFLFTAFATQFVVINPPGLVQLFIALTQGMAAEQRRRMDEVRGSGLIGTGLFG